MSSNGSARHLSPLRIGSVDFDPRPRKRTTRVREGETPSTANNNANPTPAKPFPANLEKAIAEMTLVLGGWIPAEEAVGRIDLQKRCWDLISNRLLRQGMADVANAIAGELSECSCCWYPCFVRLS